MSIPNKIEIRVEEDFPRFTHAPIVEAVLQFQVEHGTPVIEASLQSELAKRLKNYRFIISQHEFQSEFQVGPTNKATHNVRDLGWKTLRFESEDKKQIAQFGRDSFTFSRLDPYIDWQQFSSEALALWGLYTEITSPKTITRTGLRFINKIELDTNKSFEDYFHPAPQQPVGLGLAMFEFLHRDAFAVPGHEYVVNFIRTLQLPTPQVEGWFLILDIDIIDPLSHNFEPVELERRLAEMRWLKNKTFFGSINPTACDRFK